jgi:phage terminase large subunit-like protein
MRVHCASLPLLLNPNPENYAALVMNPYGNRENLPPDYIAELESLPERQKQRFLLGRFTADLDNALWTVDSFRHVAKLNPGECERIVVAVDPPAPRARRMSDRMRSVSSLPPSCAPSATP